MTQSEWRVEDYEDHRGTDVIVEFLRDLNQTGRRKAVTKLIATIDLLRDKGFSLPDDVVRKVRGDLWELRVNYQRNPYRILFYNPRGRLLVLLHAIHKKEDAIPQGDILKASERMAEDRERRGF